MYKNSQIQSPLPLWMANSPPVMALSKVYSIIINKRNARYSDNAAISYRIPFPVVSVGGIRAGGTGKTPSALLIGDLLRKLDKEIVFLSRGFRRPNKKNFIAKPGQEVSWRDAGDEPAMLHSAIPESWLGIGANRVENAEKISRMLNRKAVFILDDGFQHRRIKRNLDIVCLSGTELEDRLLPSGYLREPVTALSRAHVVFLIGTEENASMLIECKNRIIKEYPNLEIFILLQKIIGWSNLKTGEVSKTLPIRHPMAICGIARPERFFSSIKQSGIVPSKEIAFSDHHPLTIRDFHHFQKLYSNGIVMTEKDATRIVEIKSQISEEIWYLKIRLMFQTNGDLDRFNDKLLFIFAS